MRCYTACAPELGNAVLADPLGALRVNTLEGILDNKTADHASELGNLS